MFLLEPLLALSPKIGEPVEPATPCLRVHAEGQTFDGKFHQEVTASINADVRLLACLSGGQRLFHRHQYFPSFFILRYPVVNIAVLHLLMH